MQFGKDLAKVGSVTCIQIARYLTTKAAAEFNVVNEVVFYRFTKMQLREDQEKMLVRCIRPVTQDPKQHLLQVVVHSLALGTVIFCDFCWAVWEAAVLNSVELVADPCYCFQKSVPESHFSVVVNPHSCNSNYLT